MRYRRIVLAAAIAAAFACSTLLVGQANAAAGSYLRLAHLSPDTPQGRRVRGVGEQPRPAGGRSGRGLRRGLRVQAIDPGDYTISMRPSGADPNTPPVLSTTLAAKSGGAYTVAGVGMYAGISLKVLQDDLSLPPADQVRCRVIHAAASTQQLDVGFEGQPPLATNVNFAEATEYVAAPAGKWTLEVSSRDQPTVTLPVDVSAHGVYSVLVVDEGGKLAAELLTDAKAGSSGPIPAGAMDTGLGGLADRRSGERRGGLAPAAGRRILGRVPRFAAEPAAQRMTMTVRLRSARRRRARDPPACRPDRTRRVCGGGGRSGSGVAAATTTGELRRRGRPLGEHRCQPGCGCGCRSGRYRDPGHQGAQPTRPAGRRRLGQAAGPDGPRCRGVVRGGRCARRDRAVGDRRSRGLRDRSRDLPCARRADRR